MKKIVIALFAAAAVLLGSCSGGSDVKLADVFAKVKSEVKLTEMVEFEDVSSLDKFYGIPAADVADFAGGINNTGVEQEEIVFIKASDDKAADSAKTALENRLAAKLNENKNYNPEQAAIIEKCSVEKNGLYVSMIVSAEAEKITNIYKEAVK